MYFLKVYHELMDGLLPENVKVLNEWLSWIEYLSKGT